MSTVGPAVLSLRHGDAPTTASPRTSSRGQSAFSRQAPALPLLSDGSRSLRTACRVDHALLPGNWHSSRLNSSRRPQRGVWSQAFARSRAALRDDDLRPRDFERALRAIRVDRPDRRRPAGAIVEDLEKFLSSSVRASFSDTPVGRDRMSAPLSRGRGTHARSQASKSRRGSSAAFCRAFRQIRRTLANLIVLVHGPPPPPPAGQVGDGERGAGGGVVGGGWGCAGGNATSCTVPHWLAGSPRRSARPLHRVLRSLPFARSAGRRPRLDAAVPSNRFLSCSSSCHATTSRRRHRRARGRGSSRYRSPDR